MIASGNNSTVESLRIANYKANGIVVDGARNATFRDLYAENTGLYGFYPVHSSGVLIERVEVTGVRDAGIYAGQSTDIVIRDSAAYGNVIGVEVENSVSAEIYGNHFYGNSAGIFISMLPQLTSKVSLNSRIYDNVTEANNLANFAQAGETAALVPAGTGILILGGDDVTVFDNTIRDNNSAGIAVFSTEAGFDPATIDIGPNPERNRVYNNVFSGNGDDPAQVVTDLGLYGADILWDASSWEVTWQQPGATSFPPVLPGERWPDFTRRAYWRVLKFVITVLG
jgi:parallel beta-helix repeat protein